MRSGGRGLGRQRAHQGSPCSWNTARSLRRSLLAARSEQLRTGPPLSAWGLLHDRLRALQSRSWGSGRSPLAVQLELGQLAQQVLNCQVTLLNELGVVARY